MPLATELQGRGGADFGRHPDIFTGIRSGMLWPAVSPGGIVGKRNNEFANYVADVLAPLGPIHWRATTLDPNYYTNIRISVR